MANSLYAGRKARNAVWTALCYAATGFGLIWLALILGTLLWKGAGGLSLDVFTKMTAPPRVRGG
jgi:phosphate transport system permease protein